jgi:cobalt-zinc-cadmium efflux system outer membrane protein
MRISVVIAVVWMMSQSTALAGPSQGRAVDGDARLTLPRAGGQDTRSGGRPLSIEGALDEALERNPRLIALRRQFEAMQLRPAQARALMPPSFEAQIWQWPVNTLNPLNTNMYMFTVGQTLPGRGKRERRATVAEKDAGLSLAATAVEARDVVDEVKRVYAELSLARREVEIHHGTADLLRHVADVSEAKYVTARGSQQDVLKAVVELSRLHEHLVTLDERERLALARLNTLLDRPTESPVGQLAAPREDGTLPALATLQRLAIDHQPSLLVARLAIEHTEARVAAEQQEHKPDFFVKGGYMLMPGQSDSWTAIAGVTWPDAPWSRPGLNARVAEAVADRATARARLAEVENAIRLAVHESYVRANAAQERASLLRTSIVPLTEQVVAVSRVAYQADRGDFLTLIDSQRVLLDAQLAYHRALSDLAQARADLERAVGTVLPADSALRGEPVVEELVPR